MATKDWKKVIHSANVIRFDNRKVPYSSVTIVKESGKYWVQESSSHNLSPKYFSRKSDAMNYAKKYMETH